MILLKTLCIVVGLLLVVPTAAVAQESQQLSVSPSLFEISATPGQIWNSTIKIVNANAYPLEVSVSVVDFAPRGEEGVGRFIPKEPGNATQTLASWINIDIAPLTILPESAVELPFTVTLPQVTSPGGHFAAFLVGTVPSDNAVGESKLRTSQVVTSLFFLRVAGDVVESGGIREFSTTESLYQTPEADFSIRFENTGNVHLRPQGDIVITNMWGQKRGTLPLNQQSSFGNVLPTSVRNYTMGWRGEWSIVDIGRYKAVVTLAYGSDERQFTTSTTYFWVVPLLPLLGISSLLLSLIALVIWLLRLYVRRMLVQAGVAPRRFAHAEVRSFAHVRDLSLVNDFPTHPATTVIQHRTARRWAESLRSLVATLRKRVLQILAGRGHRTVVVALGVIALLFMIGLWYIYSSLAPERSFTVVYKQPDGETIVSSDQLTFAKEAQTSLTERGSLGLLATSTEVHIVNESGVAGLGATVAVLVSGAGYRVTDVQTTLGAELGRTRIVGATETTADALTLSALLGNALVSATATSTSARVVTIYVGKDLARTD